jgi:hypothetical protein
VSGIFNDERPGSLILAARQSPRENEAVLPLALRDQEPAGSSGECGEYASHADVLIIGQDAFGAKLTAVRDEVVGIPSGTARTHLGQPRPDVVRRATNRDGVIDRAQGLRNQVVSGKNPGRSSGVTRICLADGFEFSGPLLPVEGFQNISQSHEYDWALRFQPIP